MRILSVLLLALLFAGCGKAKSNDKPGDGDNGIVQPKSDTGGVIVATIDPNATTLQTVKASDSSAVKGAAVSFPPGSLAVATDVTLEEGLPIANAAAIKGLGLESGTTLASASTTLVIGATGATEATSPFTVSLPLTSTTSLIDTNDNLVIFYKVKKADGTYALGVITAWTIDGSAVLFDAKNFGAFQAARTSVKVAAAKEVAALSPITSAAALAPFLGTWKNDCFAFDDSRGSDIDALFISSSGIEEEVDAYSSSDCTGSIERIYKTSYSYSIGPAVSGQTGVREIDVTILTGTATLKSADQVAQHNSVSACGFTDWVIDVTKNIDDLKCGDEVRVPVGTILFTIAKLDANKLYFGKESETLDGSAPAKRPTTLSTEVKTKQ